ncbi:hypothetical protein FD723_40105 (plasmid) [Nostoc sp. C052]|uniref:hypothetical protein n=1 Tax=Nostoc sp. C052 TaxID=2576902 RepID=UPI0015C3896C|nr:hypothetical protein [Nostoc sp. C052]QLE46417.1 hypothetical protein FD723_40105 [Nostoc sp. C052]
MDNSTTDKVFKNQEYMNSEQLLIAEKFETMIEGEYKLCATQMKQANKAANPKDKPIDSTRISVNYACLEIDAIREYWFNRLIAIAQIIEHRNPQLAKDLSKKYLTNEE